MEVMSVRVLVAFLLHAALVEGFFNVKPKSTNVTVDRLVTFRCGTDEVGYSLFFDYVSSSGSTVTPTSSVTLPNGAGTMISVTFIATVNLDNTTVICLVLGKPEHTASAVVRVQNTREVGPCRVCQLGNYIILCWPHITVLDGIRVRYRIVDNLNTNVTVDKPHHSILYNRSTSMHYEARITVILHEVATGYNNSVHGNETNVIRTLNGKTQPILKQMGVFKDENTVGFNFSIDPKFSDECTPDTDLEQNATLKSCNGECKDFNDTIQYRDGKLISTFKVDLLRHKFISSVRFNYAGQDIETNNINTSTYKIQGVSIISDCLNIILIERSNISMIYLRLHSSGRNFEGNVSIESVQRVCFLIAQNHNISFGQGNGTWTLQAFENQTSQEPSYILENIIIDEQSMEEIEATIPSSGTNKAVPLVLTLLMIACFLLLGT